VSLSVIVCGNNLYTEGVRVEEGRIRKKIKIIAKRLDIYCLNNSHDPTGDITILGTELLEKNIFVRKLMFTC